MEITYNVTLEQILDLLPITDESFVTIYDNVAVFHDDVYDIMVKNISKSLLSRSVMKIYPPNNDCTTWGIYII